MIPAATSATLFSRTSRFWQPTAKRAVLPEIPGALKRKRDGDVTGPMDRYAQVNPLPGPLASPLDVVIFQQNAQKLKVGALNIAPSRDFVVDVGSAHDRLPLLAHHEREVAVPGTRLPCRERLRAAGGEQVRDGVESLGSEVHLLHLVCGRRRLHRPVYTNILSCLDPEISFIYCSCSHLS